MGFGLGLGLGLSGLSHGRGGVPANAIAVDSEPLMLDGEYLVLEDLA
ncbi:hypothetical protein [Jiella avicenniae]|uniref:Uncharacterized protein n=1 Tax=Jiella avicenniae TaxID=2907202 RepID=A0A9X1P3A1_9HYPH|nr:hypothetical protein [Jiella avicenniae]MCE7028491.1 hypothetical protein [Jiella avicenniae]